MTKDKFYDMLCHKSKELAKKYHKGQVDKAGKPYFLHVEAVASTFMTYDEHIVSYLHDILEDTPCCADDLYEYGIPHHLIVAIQAITRKDGESYFDFIRRVMENPIALRVKIADIRHNLDSTRFPNPDDFPASLKQRYEKALEMLLAQERIIFARK